MVMEKTCCCLLLLVSFFLFDCQKEPPAKPAQTMEEVVADSLYARADTLLDALRYDSAMLLFRSLAPRFLQQQNWEKYTTCQRKTAHCLWASLESEKAATLCLATIGEAREKLGEHHPEIAKLNTILGNIHADRRTEADFNKCLGYYQQALDIATQVYPDPSPELAGAYERFGIAHWLIDDYATSIAWYEKALAHLDSLSPKNTRTYLKIYNNLGLTYFTLGHYRKAHDFFKKARDLALASNRKKDSNFVKYLINMAQTRLNLGDADESLDLYYEALALEKETGVPRSHLQCLIYGGMGDCFAAKEEYDRAVAAYRASLAMLQIGKRDDLNAYYSNLLSLGNAFLKQSQVDSALACFQQSYRMADAAFDADSYNRVNILYQLGLAYQHKNDLPQARQYLQQALQISLEKVGNHHPSTGRLKKQLAELEFSIGALGKALQLAEDARLSFLTKKILPGEKPATVDINSLSELIEVHRLTGKIRAAQHLQNRDTSLLRQSVSAFEDALALADSLKIGLLTKTARQAAQKQVFAVAEDALNSLHQLWSANPKREYLEQIFHFMEKSKAAELLASLHDFEAKQNAGVTEAWLEKETLLKTQMSSYQNLLYSPEQIEQSGNEFKMASFQLKYLKAKSTLDSFTIVLEKNYPQYYRLKYGSDVASLSKVQAIAGAQNASVIEYFFGEQALYMLLVSYNSTLWKKINYTDKGTTERLDSTLASFIKTLADKNSQQSDPAKYFSQAYFLCKNLLPDTAFFNASTLIVVPDGLLCQLPFETLLTAPHKGNFANAPYLLRSKTLRYAWSATLLTLQNGDKTTAEKGLLQITPFTEQARDNLAALPNSPHDVPEKIEVALLKNERASVGEFLEKAPRFGVLHLSTHANAGEGIEFYDRRLILPEIYTQRLSASLVALSACETGKGQFAKGEGVLSLARAFAYAGAQSLLASHWSVNERSTAELFSAFYTNLENGLSKAEALRQAKLSYLASTEMDARKAPFHWAAFTLTGADGQVELGSTDWWKWLLGAGVLLLAVVWWWRKRG